MKTFVEILKREKGITLLEVLLGLTITLFVSSILYGAVLMGAKAYDKIGIEWKMRDEADLVITQISETLYQFKVDDIENGDGCPKGNCFTIINNRELKINTPSGIVTEANLVTEKGMLEKRIFKVEGQKIKIFSQENSGDLKLIMSTSDSYDFSNSKLYAYCTKRKQYVDKNGQSFTTCNGVTVNIKLIVNNDPTNSKTENSLFYKKLDLESQFGF